MKTLSSLCVGNKDKQIYLMLSIFLKRKQTQNLDFGSLWGWSAATKWSVGGWSASTKWSAGGWSDTGWSAAKKWSTGGYNSFCNRQRRHYSINACVTTLMVFWLTNKFLG